MTYTFENFSKDVVNLFWNLADLETVSKSGVGHCLVKESMQFRRHPIL